MRHTKVQNTLPVPGFTNVRDLRGVVDREGAEMGVLITLQEPTQPMRAEAASGGFYHSKVWNSDYPKIQILTIAELIDGKKNPGSPHALRHLQKSPKGQGRRRGSTNDTGVML